jgi:hypothetical protein
VQDVEERMAIVDAITVTRFGKPGAAILEMFLWVVALATTLTMESQCGFSRWLLDGRVTTHAR